MKTKPTSDIPWNPGCLVVRIHHDGILRRPTIFGSVYARILPSSSITRCDITRKFIQINLWQTDSWIYEICQWNERFCQCNDILLVVNVYKKDLKHLEPLLHLEEDNNHNRQHDRTPHKGDRMAICQLSFREGPWPNMARRPKQRKGDEQVATTAKDGKASAKVTMGSPIPLNNRALPGKPYEHYHDPRADCSLGWGKYLNL